MRREIRDTVGESTPLERVKAADAFYDLDKEDQQALWENFSEAERDVVIRGNCAEERAQAGTQEAYKQLSADQQEVVVDLQTGSSLEGSGARRQAMGRVKAAAEKMSGMSEEQRGQIKNALPERARKAFKKALEKAQEASKESKAQSEDDDRSQDQGQSRGGWGRGR